MLAEKLELLFSAGETEMIQLLWEQSAVPQRLNVELPYDLAVPLLGVHTQEKGKLTSTQKPVHECS